MPNQDDAIRRLRGQIRALLWAKYSLLLCALWAFVWGTGVLAGRVGMQIDRLPLVWGALGLVPMLAIAWWLAERKTPAPQRVRALIDRHSNAGGLLMAAEEADIRHWSDRVPQVAMPGLSWRGGRAWTALLIALAFVGVAFAVPSQLAALADRDKLDVQNQAAFLEQQIETLKEEKILEAEAAEDLQQKLNQITEDASASDPMKTFEALDHLARGLKNTAEEAAEQAIGQTEKAAEVEAATEGVQRAAEQMDAAELKEALRELAEMAEQAREDGALNKLDESTLAALKQMAEQDPQALQEALREAQSKQAMEDLAEAMEQLGPMSLARVDAAGEVTLFEPDTETTLADLAAEAPNDDYAVQAGPNPAVYKSEFGKRIEMDPAVKQRVFGEGEKVVGMAGDRKLGVYTPSGTADRTKLDELPADQVATIDVSGAVQTFAKDEQATQQCNNAMKAGNNMSAEALQKLAQAAQGQQMDLKQMMQALANAQMIDAEAIQKMQEAGQIDRAQLAQLLEQAGQMSGQAFCQQAGQCAGGSNKPGRGGINRGRGDAPMTWKDPTSEQGSQFKEQVLPPGAMNPEDSRRVGVSVGAPTVEDGSGSSGGQLSGAEAGGGSANRHRILPQHRGVIERHFQQDQ